MPDETKGPDAVSPGTGGEKPPSGKVAAADSSPEKVSETPTATGFPAVKPAKGTGEPGSPPAEKAAAKPVAAPVDKSDAAKAPPLAAAKPAAAVPKPAPKPEGPKPLPWESDLVTRLRAQYGSGLKEASTYVGQNYLIVDSSIVFEVLRKMREDEQFDYCVDITAVHYPKREQPFDLIYILYSFPRNERVRVKTLLNDGEYIRTTVSIWPTANWLEREVFDMFGIQFEGHPDLKRILLPDGWKGHPLRKDYPILQQDKEWVQINLGIESGQ